MVSRSALENALKRLNKERGTYEEEIIETNREIDQIEFDGNSSKLAFLKSKLKETNAALDDVNRQIFECQEKLKEL
jgi:uncharacterized coiled-coil DUF342 family protein